jgi:hypothetical protein
MSVLPARAIAKNEEGGRGEEEAAERGAEVEQWPAAKRESGNYTQKTNNTRVD